MNTIAALSQFISSRPGFDPNNYSDAPSYRADVREAGKQLADARALLRYVELFNVPLDSDAFRAFGGRLSFDGERLDYCTGQYYPLEYRRAAAAVLASAIWKWWRDDSLLQSPPSADKLRRKARREFGRRIALNYFN